MTLNFKDFCGDQMKFLDFQASWIKGKDTSVLSVGLHKFSSDKRISIASGGRNSKEESFWILQVLNFQDGLYLK